MTPTTYRTPEADEDIREIAFRIGVEDGRPATAERIIDSLLDCCERLAALSAVSKLGTSLPQLSRGVRAFSHKRWVILFRYVDDGIIVLRIADGSQDYLSWKLE